MGPGPRAGSGDPDADAVLAAERRWLVAHTTGDTHSLDALMADEYRLVATDGSVRNRSDILRAGAAGRTWDLARNVVDQIQLHGDVAVVFGRYWVRAAGTGLGPDSGSRYLAVWVRRGRGWQIVADQATPLPGPGA